MEVNKIYFFIFLSGFLAGTSVATGIAVFFYLRKLRRYRRENDELGRNLELCNRTIEQYRSKISTIRGDLKSCQSNLTASLGDITSIRDASKAIRKQVEVLEKYVIDTRSVYDSINRGFCDFDKSEE